MLPFSDFPIPSLPCDLVFTFRRRYTFAVSTFPPALLCAPADINHRHNTCACILHIAFGLRGRPYIFPWSILCANTEYRVVSPAPNRSFLYPFRCPLPLLLHPIVFVRECTCENVARLRARSTNLRIGEGGRTSPCPSVVAVDEAYLESRVDSGVLSKRDYFLEFSKACYGYIFAIRE